jgi:hypothetical protein
MQEQAPTGASALQRHVRTAAASNPFRFIGDSRG